MKTVGTRGGMDALLIPLIFITLLLFVSMGFGYWAFNNMQNYKNNSDAISAAAVQAADKQLTAQLNTAFAEKEKNPLKTYHGPEQFGSLVIKYPRTWSAYVAEKDQDSTPVDGYFYPGAVPDIANAANAFALRVQVVAQSPSEVLQNYQDNVQQGNIRVRPFKLALVPSVVGSYISGQIQDNKQGQMVVLPLRNQTLLIWTESKNFQNDFNNIILKNFSFSP